MGNSFRFSLSLGFLGLILAPVAGHAVTLPEQTTLPVMFTSTLNSAKVKAGDAVTARTMQVVLLPGGEQLPKGSLVRGHVVEARPFRYDDTPYADQQPSYLSIVIDSLIDQGVSSPVAVSVRALASNLAVQDALTPTRLDESDSLGTMVLIGGAQYSPIGKRITEGVDGDVVGYNKKQGVFARPLPASYESRGASYRCGGNHNEQSMAVFSPDACGLYGFVSEYLTANGGNGPIRVESTHHTVDIRAGSAMLLEVRSAR